MSFNGSEIKANLSDKNDSSLSHGEMRQPAVIIDDTTLRDGEQSAGVAFTADEKISIAIQLASMGVPELEIGIPAMGAQEQEVMKAIADLKLGSKLLAWCRMTTEDLKMARLTGVDMIDLSIPVSDQQIEKKLGASRGAVLERIMQLVPMAKDAGFDVCVGCEDASRADMDFLKQVAEVVQISGARRIRFADTVGIMEPFSAFNKISALKTVSDLEIEMHAHDDFGLATANTLAAVAAGATHINTTVNGLGERAGNAPLEELVMALTHLHGIETGINPLAIPAVSEFVSSASGRPVSWQKSIVGEGVFTHEAGIHVDGLMKDQRNYEALPPKALGKQHRFILGKHSGTHQLREIFRSMEMDITLTEANQVLLRVRQFTTDYKCSPGREDLLDFYSEVNSDSRAAANG